MDFCIYQSLKVYFDAAPETEIKWLRPRNWLHYTALFGQERYNLKTENVAMSLTYLGTW
jgi:hypothetical protein